MKLRRFVSFVLLFPVLFFASSPVADGAFPYSYWKTGTAPCTEAVVWQAAVATAGGTLTANSFNIANGLINAMCGTTYKSSGWRHYWEPISLRRACR